MLTFNKRLLAEPNIACPWAEKMILNPAIIQDPYDKKTLHMLFRSTGSCADKQLRHRPLPYPIFLGYAVSNDRGAHWQFDYSRPAMSPALKYEPEELCVSDIAGNSVINYANGCIEDPRLFHFENEIYLSAACRVFPPGPYWEYDCPVQCAPNWINIIDHGLGRAVIENSTVTLLFKVNIEQLSARKYENAFELVCPLHNPDLSDDRDAFLFPRKLEINGKKKIVCIHRPKHPWKYPGYEHLTAPSIFLAAGNCLTDFATENVERHLLAVPELSWESNRIGASWAPIELNSGEWLFPYHGKQNDTVGYTQSFMLLNEQDTGFPEIVSRPTDRLIYPQEKWELDGDFSIPCIFSCSGVVDDERGILMMGCGIADQKIAMIETSFTELVDYLRQNRYESGESKV
ncbi:MAG: hypothetical protein JXR78_13075 [Victivallales bacterium]|nr:hypothetical protein [Victivallales bacterium]